MDKYRSRAESDLDEAFGDEISLYSDISQPNELLDLILENIIDAPDALGFLIQTFRSMLLIKGDADKKYVSLFLNRTETNHPLSVY